MRIIIPALIGFLWVSANVSASPSDQTTGSPVSAKDLADKADFLASNADRQEPLGEEDSAQPEPAKSDCGEPARGGDPGLAFPRVDYEVRASDDEARVLVEVIAESTVKHAAQQTLFEGELALVPPKLPPALRIERTGNVYRLLAAKPGRYHFSLELIAKVVQVEPWNEISFKGPAAAIASVTAEAAVTNVELQLLSGTALVSTQTNGLARVKGFLGPEQTVALRWSRAGGVGKVARQAVVTAETSANVQITPTVIKYATQMRLDILQGKVSSLRVALPVSHTLTRLLGEQIRDWEIKPATSASAAKGEAVQILEVQFIKPLENQYQLTLYSEQAGEATGLSISLMPPQPLATERESGSLTISTEDTLAEVDSAAGLRRVNAPAGALAAYRFDARPVALAVKLRRIEPVISVAERVSVRVEETRLVSVHALNCNIEKAGVYGLDLRLPYGFTVAEVRGEGVEDWKANEPAPGGERRLRVNFSNRILGIHTLEVQLEQSLKTFPQQIALGPLRVAGAAKESSEVGAGAAAGIRLKTAEMSGMREVPVRTLQKGTNETVAALADELLGYKAEQADWKLGLATERLAARVVAEVFNLVTIGDGIVGGSATIRYGLLNQGVQEFDIEVPASWKNVEFTGPNIRRKEQRKDGTWAIGLQDKAWGGYTLVITYDYQFEPKGATLAIGGIHTLGVERETGSVAITTAASLQLNPKTLSESLRRVDELELSAANRALITRSVLLAYQYDEIPYSLEVEVKGFEEVSVLSAVADRTQLTSVLTDAGEMLTQASFMVKNNDKQFQRFKLPKDANFWNCHVNGQPVKAQRDGDWLMAPLPRGANRDQAFAVDIVYAETNAAKPALLPRAFWLQAPQTDVPNTYAEWQLYAPVSYRLSGFAGNMTPVRGTTYDLQDAWQKFTRFYWDFLHEAGPGLLFLVTLIGLVVALIASAIRRGPSGVMTVLITFAILAILASMLLPALSRAKARSQRMIAVNSLKQIGLAAKTWALDNNDRLPGSFDEMMNELGTDKITYDPETGQRFVYVGAGQEFEKIQPESIIAFSPTDSHGYRAVLFADGSVQQVTSSKFEELSRRGWIVAATAQQVAQNQQAAAVRGAQFQPASVVSPPENGANGPGMPVGPRVHSIRIDIPHEGQAFAFTKVLHLDNKPLAVQVKVMRLQTFQMAQMCLQVAGFMAGLLLWWRQWRGARNTFLLTVALALSLCAVGSLLLAWRILHLTLIWLAPLLLLVCLAWLTWKFWPRSQSAPAKTGFEPGIPPAVAGIAFLVLSLASANAFSRASHTANAASVLSAAYTGTVSEHVAQISATLLVNSSEPNQQLRLFGDDVAVQDFASKPSHAKLVRHAQGVAVLLPHRGETTLQLGLLVKLGGDVSKRRLAFAIPGALSSQVAFTIDQPEADIEFPAAVSAKRTTTGQRTQVTAVMGSAERLELLWTPRMKRAGEVAANIICQNATIITMGNGVLNARATLDYQVTQGEMPQARVRLPSGHRLLRVEGQSIRSWEVKPDSQGQLVEVELLRGIASNYRLMIETERILEPVPTSIKVQIPHALGVKRETGLLAIGTDEELELAAESAEELYRVDVEEFARLTGQKVNATINAFRFLKPEFTLQERIAPMLPQIEAVLHNNFRVGQEQVSLGSTIDYTIKRAGIFALKLALPAGYRMENLNGANILQSTERTEAGQRVLDITLQQRTGGAYALRIELMQLIKQLPKTLNLPGIHPIGMQKLTGFVHVSAEPGVALKANAFDGLTEVPALTIGATDNSPSGSALAYKFIAAEPAATPGWKLEVETENVESWVRAEIVNTVTVSDTLINGRALARFDIQNAPVKELRLRIPALFKNVEISGSNIRRRDHEGESWKVEFQSRIRGPHILTVTWDQAREAKTNRLELQGIAADNVERQTGVLVVVARPPLQITQLSAGELKPIDLRDLPDWAGQPDPATVLAYRYLRPGYQLGVEARRFAEAEVLQCLVDNLKLSTVVADDGQMMTEMSLSVRNQGRQHLEIALPPETTVWSAFVGGQAVRPSIKEGRLLLPLERSIGEDAAIPLDVVYVSSKAFPQRHGALELSSPKLDAPVKSARWELFLPPDYAYTDFGGSMAHEVETAMLEASSFSLLDYSSRETRSKAELAREFKSELSSAQKKLSSGNVKEALADYNRARNKADVTAANNNEARQLEADLRRAQGNNLIQAQNAFSFSNAGQMNQATQLVSGTASLRYDAATAEAQWTKLQQAQDLGVANVQPIRINLPTRGLRHAFTQVLQTETGKPLTIRLFASNVRAFSWPKRLAGSLLAFVALWIIVWLVSQRAHFGKRVTEQ